MGAIISRNFVFGLFVYIRQAALSLHRAGPDPRQSLRRFYSSNDLPLPAKIGRILGKLNRRPAPKHLPRVATEVLFRRKIWLDTEMLNRLIDSLQSLSRILSDSNTPEDTRIKVRLELSILEELVRRKLPRRMAKAGTYVEHFNQNESLRLRSFHDIVGRDWPGLKTPTG